MNEDLKKCEKVGYIQMPLKSAVVLFPELKKILPADMFDDDDYLVRFTRDGKLEIGYTTDAWAIQ